MIGALVAGITGSGGAVLSSYESIATANPSGSTVTFSSIPATYKHLQIRILGRRNSATTSSSIFYKFNNVSTGTPYDFHYLYGDGSTTLASGQASANFMQLYEVITGDSSTSARFGVCIVDILDYASTTKNKTVRAFGGQDQTGSGGISISSGLWRSTNARDRIDFDIINYSSGTQFALYGIKEA